MWGWPYLALSPTSLLPCVRCLTCETITSREETFIDLSIDIEQNSSLHNCLRNFSSSETLDRDDKFFCDYCCTLQEAQKWYARLGGGPRGSGGTADGWCWATGSGPASTQLRCGIAVADGNQQMVLISAPMSVRALVDTDGWRAAEVMTTPLLLTTKHNWMTEYNLL